MLVKINEEKLQNIISESIKKVLKEGEYLMSADNPEEFGFLWDELASGYEDNNSQGNDSVFCEVGFFAVNKMCENNGYSFGKNARIFAKKYYMNSEFRNAFNKVVNKVRLQRM